MRSKYNWLLLLLPVLVMPTVCCAVPVVGNVDFRIAMTGDGPVRGVAFDGVASWKGVPFAAPPVGDLRWRRPAAVQPWAPNIRDTLSYAPDCICSRKSDYIKAHNLSEDCLYLNIFAPDPGPAASGRDQASLPVLVFLYGGSWEFGGSSFPIYDGSALAKDFDVIIVTVNYRLGPFGFLGSLELADDDEFKSTGNYGLQDQRQALQWVQRNIAAFGGDPTRTLLFGESAGAGSVVSHLVTRGSSGLFQYAAMESGPPSDWSSMPMSEASAEFDRLAAAANCSAVPSSVVSCLRGISAEGILQYERENSSLMISWSPVVDHVELLDQPQRLWERHQTNPVKAILLGSNTDEGTDFVDQAKNVANETAYEQFVAQRYPGRLGQRILQLYPFAQFSRGGFATSMIFGDSLMACPARRGARWMTQQGVPAFLYHFEHEPAALKLLDPDIGVAHAVELPFVFGFAPILWSKADNFVSRAMMGYWSSLAQLGKPSVIDGVQWPVFDLKDNSLLRINSTIMADSNYKLDACALWDRVYEAGCQVAICPCSCDNITLPAPVEV